MDPVAAVVLGCFVFVLALSLQFLVRRYMAWTYWLAVAVAAVGGFGTMAADVPHVRFGVPYAVYGIALVVVFVSCFTRAPRGGEARGFPPPRR